MKKDSERNSLRGCEKKRSKSNEKEVISGLFRSAPPHPHPPSIILKYSEKKRKKDCLFQALMNTMQGGSTCLAACLTLCEAHKW